jgi:general nucleoside transport system permease protein
MPTDGLMLLMIVNVLASTVRLATPLLLAATGELVSERAGVQNLGLEGTMLMGAITGYWTANVTGSVPMAIAAAMLVGALMALILVFVSVTLKANQSVAGLTLNILASGISLFWYRMSFEAANPPVTQLVGAFPIPFLSSLPFLGEILFSHTTLTYFAFAMVPVVSIFLYQTRFGLRLRAIGENPRAGDLGGLNVTRYQYFAAVFSGMMGGLGGAFLTLALTSRFLPNMSAGRGWLAIVIIVAGNWKPRRILAATLVFAFLDALQYQIQGVGVNIPFQYLLMLPYVVAILVMMASRTRSQAPKAMGVAYLRE